MPTRRLDLTSKYPQKEKLSKVMSSAIKRKTSLRGDWGKTTELMKMLKNNSASEFSKRMSADVYRQNIVSTYPSK
jgi:hypothetical protein